MKRLNLSLVVVAMLTCLLGWTLASESAAPDFRKASWGTTKEQVKGAESGKPKDDTANVLLYVTDLPGFDDVAVVYHFADNKLVRCNYAFLKQHTNANDYIEDFKRVKKSMVEKYGRPRAGEEDAIWKDDLYKDEPDNWGMAVSSGHLVYQAVWQTGRTDILLTLSGDNFKIDLDAQYTSRELGHLEKESKENPF